MKAFLILLLLLVGTVHAESIRFVDRSVPDDQAHRISDNKPLSFYIDVNACAVSGRIISIDADDKGDVRIMDDRGGVSFARHDGPKAGVTAGSGTFNPQSATVNWWSENTQQPTQRLIAHIQFTYGSQNGYTWDGVSCIPPDILDLHILGTPKENQFLEVSCEMTAPNVPVRLELDDSGSFTTADPSTWTDNFANFTINTSSAGEKTLSCVLGDVKFSKQVTVAPDHQLAITGLKVAVNCAQGTTVLNWDPVLDASYTISLNNITNVTSQQPLFSSKTTSTTSYWYVKAVRDGQPGPATMIMSEACPLSPLQVPDSFQRAHFAKSGDKSIIAHWSGDKMVIVYTNFTSEFSNEYTVSGANKIIQKTATPSAANILFWRAYTSGIKP